MSPAVWVGPEAAPELVAAADAGGARLVTEPSEAEIIVWFGGAPHDFAEIAHPGIHWVQLPNAGVEPWFEAGMISSAHTFTSAAGSYAPVVAEHALALLLAAAKNIPVLARARTWTGPAPATLRGAQVGIVGCGGIGRELIHLLQPLGAEVLAITRSGTPVPGARTTWTPDGLHDLLTRSDHVVLAAPTTPATQSLIGAAELRAMKSSAWSVNIGRGALVDTDALVTALRSGTIAGAALDVTDPEPLPDGHPLWTEPRAMITPHTANSRTFLLPALADRVTENLLRLRKGDPLVGRIDPAAGY
jgi:phosphoglycerate dehydrogenase-like enzyme